MGNEIIGSFLTCYLHCLNTYSVNVENRFGVCFTVSMVVVVKVGENKDSVAEDDDHKI